MELDDKLRAIQTRISQVQSKVARSQVELDNATEKRDAAKAALKQDFGVVTNDEAKAKLKELEEALVEAVATVERELEEAGA
jgi:predicted  nucleic acid-binding Zn-ribbon protein